MIRAPYTGPLVGMPTLTFDKVDARARSPERTNSIAWDIFAYLLTESGRETSRAIHQKGVTEVRTGLIFHPPPDHYLQVTSKTSLTRRGVFVANAPGLVDPTFEEELTILLFNGSYQTEYVAHGHRIAQVVLLPIPKFDVRERLPAPEHQEDVHP